jgi:hypothetical protein
MTDNTFYLQTWEEVMTDVRIFQLRRGNNHVQVELYEEELVSFTLTPKQWKEHIAKELCAMWWAAFHERVYPIMPMDEGMGWGFTTEETIEGELVEMEVEHAPRKAITDR